MGVSSTLSRACERQRILENVPWFFSGSMRVRRPQIVRVRSGACLSLMIVGNRQVARKCVILCVEDQPEWLGSVRVVGCRCLCVIVQRQGQARVREGSSVHGRERDKACPVIGDGLVCCAVRT